MTRPDPGPSLSSPRTAPSIHVRAALTWLAIFPLVAIGIMAMAPFTVGWDPVLRAFVLPRRWCVERTFSWINRCRRTVRDYERLPQHHAAMIQWAMIALMTRRLAHHHT